MKSVFRGWKPLPQPIKRFGMASAAMTSEIFGRLGNSIANLIAAACHAIDNCLDLSAKNYKMSIIVIVRLMRSNHLFRLFGYFWTWWAKQSRSCLDGLQIIHWCFVSVARFQSMCGESLGFAWRENPFHSCLPRAVFIAFGAIFGAGYSVVQSKAKSAPLRWTIPAISRKIDCWMSSQSFHTVVLVKQ